METNRRSLFGFTLGLVALPFVKYLPKPKYKIEINPIQDEGWVPLKTGFILEYSEGNGDWICRPVTFADDGSVIDRDLV